MSLLGAMDMFGLGHLKNIETDKSAIDGEAEKAGLKEAEKKVVVEETEEDYIYSKDFECPVCSAKFKQLVVKASKARAISTDKDLKPVYKTIDPLKYDVIHCNHCGYAVLSRYYGPLAKPHKEMLKQTIASKYKPSLEIGRTITYGQAFNRMQLALANAMCRQAKSSEIALIYLKMGWLLRSMQQHLDELPKNKEDFKEENLKAMEEESLTHAMDCFIKARLSENPPIAGMNEVTVDYLLAVLCMRFKDYDNAAKMIQNVISSQQANATQKDKARDLKDELRALKK